MNEKEKERRYQWVGSIFDIVKKQAVTGWPIPSTWGTRFSKKCGGASKEMGWPELD